MPADPSRYLTPVPTDVPEPSPKEVSEHLAIRQRFAAYAGHIPPVRLECSWCGTTIREGREPTSHGICMPCSAKHFPKDGGPDRAA